MGWCMGWSMDPGPCFVYVLKEALRVALQTLQVHHSSCIRFEIKDDPCELIGAQQFDSFTNRNSFALNLIIFYLVYK